MNPADNGTNTGRRLPLLSTERPEDCAAVAESIRRCYEHEQAVYPLGGGTGLAFGGTAAREGVGLSLAQLAKIVVFDPEKRFVTAQAGLTVEHLGQVLRAAQQRLPIDVPHPALATLGGAIAANANGPRQYAGKGWCDSLQSLRAVDGRGQEIGATSHLGTRATHSGWLGPLLTGSLGCLAVITEVTLRTEPIPPRLSVLCCAPRSLEQAEELLATLVHIEFAPVAIEFLCGPFWSRAPVLTQDWDRSTDLRLAVAFEGTDTEVTWVLGQLQADWSARGITACATLDDAQSQELLVQVSDFSALDSAARLLRATVSPGGVARFMAEARSVDSRCSLQAHAGSGVINLRVSDRIASPVPTAATRRLRKAARTAGGVLVPLSTELIGYDTGAVCGNGDAATWNLMKQIKSEFDPKHLLNPDRFL